MEAIISALGVILSALMELPSRTVAATDAKKASISKTLTQFVNVLDAVIARGYLILSKLESLATLKDGQEFKENTKELLSPIKSYRAKSHKLVPVWRQNCQTEGCASVQTKQSWSRLKP